MDKITPEHRSWNMGRIRGKDTSIEISVRKYLFSRGLRYRKNDKRFPGKPDIVLPKYKVVIFINGCFWHFHKDCKFARLPKTNTDYWQKKLSKNTENDELHNEQLVSMGWYPITLWECELKKDFQNVMEQTIRLIKSRNST